MLYFISIGVGDEKDMSIKALEIARSCDLLFAELYTTKLNTTKEKLEELIGKPIRVLSREEVEEKYQEIIFSEAKEKKVGFLVGGDCFVATTHIALRQEAIKQGIKVGIIHGSSILSAVGEIGLHLNKFGPYVTIPFPERTKGKLPESVYDVVKMNRARGLHTLCLLDVNENYCMTVKEAINILLELENSRKEKVIKEDLGIVVFSKAGSEDSKIIFNSISNLKGRDFESPAVLIIPGILHFIEEESLKLFIS